jgi:hypothetical protein
MAQRAALVRENAASEAAMDPVVVRKIRAYSLPHHAD